MGNISKRPNGKYRARYRDENRKEHARHFATRKEASAWLAVSESSVLRGEHVTPNQKVTLGRYADDWLERQITKPTTIKAHRSRIKRLKTQPIAQQYLKDVTKGDVQKYVRYMIDAGLSPTTVKVNVDTLGAIFNAAVDERMLVRSPCHKVMLPSGARSKAKLTVPAPEAVRDLIDALRAAQRPTAAALVGILAGTGLRIGEALGLELTDYDAKNLTLHIERQRLETGYIGPTKNNENRLIPIPASVGALIEESLPLLSLVQTPYGHSAWHTDFKMVGGSAKYGFTAHDLRHFAASALISGGASIKQVQTFLGHSSAKVTLDTYSHLWPGDNEKARAILSEAINPLL